MFLQRTPTESGTLKPFLLLLDRLHEQFIPTNGKKEYKNWFSKATLVAAIPASKKITKLDIGLSEEEVVMDSIRFFFILNLFYLL